MAVRSSISRFPVNLEEQESSGLPWGITVTPFSATDERGAPPIRGGADGGGRILPRCEHCWAYFSTYCDLENWAWTCALCGNYNGLTSDSIKRFSSDCPELSSSFIDLELEPTGDDESGDIELKARPVYVAVVDLCSSEEFIELIKSALLAALEALVPGSLFGLVTFSHKIGLYDVQGPIPVVKNVFMLPDLESTLPMPLQDVMPLLSFLAPVETCKDRIIAALETLRPATSWERTAPSAGEETDGVYFGGRGFGSTITALIDYLGSEYGTTFALADAVQAGVCVDLFAVTDEYTDLASLKFLSIDSGGSLFYYSNTDDSTLPQDMYRMLSRPYAFGCILRLRTSSDYKPGNAYGHFFPDPQYENVQHIICCDSFATYAYDFAFDNKEGFSRHSDHPIVQMAFQYSVIEPVDESPANGPNSSTSFKFCVKRRLRIRTLQFAVARNIHEIYDSVDTEAILSILVHKVILASLEEGVREGRNLLTDWLVILTAQYETQKPSVSDNNGSLMSQIDVSFSQCPELQPLPRLIFALLRNSLLRLHEEEPSSLHKAIYPVLMSYSSPDKQAYPRHSLSRAALITSGSPIFLLDAFTDIIVYYSSTADPSLPFPPPHDCLLRATINKLKQDRCITPKLTFIQGGKDDVTLFENYLIEEQEVDGSIPAVNVMGFVSFLQDISREVLEYLK
ncbi:protein transport protein SEC23-like protein [Carex littledalei]|uniref:Protein transport protein SEC23-like protein n=1 Tax=Carex littledalei TaxID=544730 RepID=A0A833VM01_9POAL|nr:protein transport protein SEC23-like protein [Carex littledalei]